MTNIIANLLGGFGNALLLLITTPFFFKQLGSDGFGIYGLWLLLQLLSSLFDGGLGGSLTKELSKVPSKVKANNEIVTILYTYEKLYCFLAVLISIILASFSGLISFDWLKLNDLSVNYAHTSLICMSPAVGLFFLNTLYQNAMIGMQKHSRMNGILLGFNIVRQVGGICIIYLVANGIPYLFVFYASIYAVQSLISRNFVFRYFVEDEYLGKKFDFEVIRRNSKFTSGLALTTILSLLVASLDRLMVSKMLSVNDFGKYTLAFSATGVMQLIFIAFYRSYYPKLSQLYESNERSEMMLTYASGCIFLGALLIPVTLNAIVFAPNLFEFWIGEQPSDIVNVFRLLLIGISCAGLMWMPIAFQQACGKSSIHLSLLALALFIGAPICYFMIRIYGLSGAPALWLFHGLTELVLGLWLTHRIFKLFNIRKWYIDVVIIPLLVSIPITSLIVFFINMMSSSFLSICFISFMTIVQVSIIISLFKFGNFYNFNKKYEPAANHLD